MEKIIEFTIINYPPLKVRFYYVYLRIKIFLFMQNKVFYLLTIMLMVIFSSCSSDDEKEQYPKLKYPTTQMLNGTTWYQKSGSTTYMVGFKGNKITMVGKYGGSYGTYTISDKHMIVTVSQYQSSVTYRLSCPMFLKSSSTGEYELFLSGDPDADHTPVNLPKGSYYRYYGESPF